MPRFIDPNGISRWVPGVYSRVDAVVNLPGPLPDFLVPMLIGDAKQGYPFNYLDLVEDHESGAEWAGYYGTSSAMEATFGRSSELSIAMRYAKRHGLPGTFAICTSPLTRASKIATSAAGAVEQLKVYSRLFGAPGGYIKVGLTGNVLTVVPVKRFALLTSNLAGGAIRSLVDDNSWIKVGQTYTLGSNTVAAITRVVAAKGTEVSATGQIQYWVEWTVAPGALTTAQYAMVVEYDDAKTETIATGSMAAASVRDAARLYSKYIDAVNAAGFTGVNVDAVATPTALKDAAAPWTTPVAGTSPASSSTEHDDLIADLDGGRYGKFSVDNGVLFRTVCVVSSSSTVHQSWRDWARSMRADRNIAVSITVGCAWGDIDLAASNDTNPAYRAAALNDQNTMLVDLGLDKLGAYLTRSPAVWALRVAGGIGHNLTWDQLTYTDLEHVYDEWGSGELTLLAKAGVCTMALRLVGGAPAYVVMQGLSTLQDNEVAWNDAEDTTCLVAQRDNADAVDAAMLDAFGRRVGDDGVTPDGIRAVAVAKAAQLARKGWITDGTFRINSIELDATGSGYNVDWASQQAPTADFIGSTFHLIVE